MLIGLYNAPTVRWPTSCQVSSSDACAEKYPVSWTTWSSRKIWPLGRNDIAIAVDADSAGLQWKQSCWRHAICTWLRMERCYSCRIWQLFSFQVVARPIVRASVFTVYQLTRTCEAKNKRSTTLRYVDRRRAVVVVWSSVSKRASWMKLRNAVTLKSYRVCEFGGRNRAPNEIVCGQWAEPSLTRRRIGIENRTTTLPLRFVDLHSVLYKLLRDGDARKNKNFCSTAKPIGFYECIESVATASLREFAISIFGFMYV